MDKKFFKQALLNLVQNSMNAIQDNGIIEIEAYKSRYYLFINIIDRFII